MEDFSEDPLVTGRKRHRSYQPKKKICSNCCQTCYGPRKKSQNQTPGSDYNSIEDDDELYEMLAVIYKLNYISSDDQSQNQNQSQSQNFIINKSSLTLCSSCTRLLYKFYPLFSQFNQLRQLDSQLAQGIKAVDKILISHQFNSNDNNSNNINNNCNRELKHDGFSPADGPWVKIGKRLEELEFKEIGYKPQKNYSRPRSRQNQNQTRRVIKRLPTLAVEKKEVVEQKQTEQMETEGDDWPILNDPIDISDGDNDNDNDDDWIPDDMEKQMDVKLFTEPISDSIDENLLLSNETNELSLPENKSKSKSSKKIKSKLEIESDFEAEEEENDDDDEDEPYSPKPKGKGKRKPRAQKQKRSRAKKERPKKYKSQATRVIKTDRRNERRRQRYHKNRDMVISGYKPPPEKEEELKCVVNGCKLEFKKGSELKLHERRAHTKDGPYICNLPLNCGAGPPCTSTFPILFLLKRHQQTSKHVPPDESLKVKCEECGKFLQNRLVYNIHFYRHHTEHGRKLYDEDQKRIAEKQKKERAEERQLLLQKGFFCDICQIDFQTKMKLTSHKIAAHDDYGKRYKPYVCEICGKKCLGLYRLNQHVTIVHSDERPVICSICGRRYKTEGHLRGHMKTGHDEEGRRKYNQYMRESNRRRKELAEALARKAQESENGQEQNQNEEEQELQLQQQQLLPSSSLEHQQQQISIGETLLLNISNPIMDFTFTTSVQNP